MYNEGVGAVGAAELEILWPVEKDPGEYDSGKHLLYLMQTEVGERTPDRDSISSSMSGLLDTCSGFSVVNCWESIILQK